MDVAIGGVQHLHKLLSACFVLLQDGHHIAAPVGLQRQHQPREEFLRRHQDLLHLQMEEVHRTWPPIAKLLSSSLPESLLASTPKLSPLKLSPAPTRISGPHSTSDEGNGCDFVYGYSASSYPVNPNAKHEV